MTIIIFFIIYVIHIVMMNNINNCYKKYFVNSQKKNINILIILTSLFLSYNVPVYSLIINQNKTIQ